MKNNTQSRQKVVLTQSLTDNATQKNTPLGSTSRKEDFNRVQHDIQ